MKKFKIIAVMLIALLILPLFSGCSRAVDKEEDFLIVTSFYPMYVFTKNITEGAENVNVLNMTEPQTGCLHDYQLLPEDIKTLEKADVFVINGGGMEAFMEKAYENVKDLEVITASEGIDFISLECEEHEHHSHHDHEHEELNSHVWTYVPNAVKEVENITKGLCEFNPGNEKIYRENAEKYIKKLNAVHEEFKEFSDSAGDIKLAVTHEAFDYMAKGYGFEIAGYVISGHNTQPSAGELSDLTGKIKDEEVIGIFKEPQYPDGVINTLARETGADIYELDPMVTGEEEYKDVYEAAMLKNLKTIKTAREQKGYGN